MPSFATTKHTHPTGTQPSMIIWANDIPIYLFKEPVDFRKSINGLSSLVESEFAMSPFDRVLFVFRNRNRRQIKVLYWDDTGFVLWQKRLEKDKFKWPKKQTDREVMTLTHEQWCWLLRGFDINQIRPHQALSYQSVM